MTNDQVIDMLCRVFDAGNGETLKWADDAKKALELAIDLLRRAEPMKVRVEECTSWGRTYFQPICPKCDMYVVPTQFIGNGEKISYCDSCGQALCWEGVNWPRW